MEENNDVIMNNNNNSNNAGKSNNKMALASFILSLVGLVVAGIPCGIAAIITGALGLTKFNPETEKNKWMAIFGIVLGALDVLLVAVFLRSFMNSLGLF